MRVKQSVKQHVSYRDVCEIYLTKRALNWLITEQGDLANINMLETVNHVFNRSYYGSTQMF